MYATFSREVGAFTLTEAAVNKHVSSEKGKYKSFWSMVCEDQYCGLPITFSSVDFLSLKLIGIV